MQFPNDRQLKALRERYPAGTPFMNIYSKSLAIINLVRVHIEDKSFK